VSDEGLWFQEGPASALVERRTDKEPSVVSEFDLANHRLSPTQSLDGDYIP
jgi:hypothetical protein